MTQDETKRTNGDAGRDQAAMDERAVSGAMSGSVMRRLRTAAAAELDARLDADERAAADPVASIMDRVRAEAGGGAARAERVADIEEPVASVEVSGGVGVGGVTEVAGVTEEAGVAGVVAPGRRSPWYAALAAAAVLALTAFGWWLWDSTGVEAETDPRQAMVPEVVPVPAPTPAPNSAPGTGPGAGSATDTMMADGTGGPSGRADGGTGDSAPPIPSWRFTFASRSITPAGGDALNGAGDASAPPNAQASADPGVKGRAARLLGGRSVALDLPRVMPRGLFGRSATTAPAPDAADSPPPGSSSDAGPASPVAPTGPPIRAIAAGQPREIAALGC